MYNVNHVNSIVIVIVRGILISNVNRVSLTSLNSSDVCQHVNRYAEVRWMLSVDWKRDNSLVLLPQMGQKVFVVFFLLD